MKKIYLILLILLTFQYGWTKEVTPSLASQIALNFMSERSASSQTLTVDNIIAITNNNINVLYAINFANNEGYVIVSADDRAKAVVAFVESGTYNGVNNEQAAYKYQIEEYSKQLYYIIQNQIPSTKEIQAQWAKYSKPLSSKGTASSIGPLLTTIWSQGCFYNDSTPTAAGGPCGHVVTGCVATAMAQVMNYHNFPNIGSGSHSYYSNYGLITANYGITNYPWNLMADTLNSSSTSAEVAAVAQLMSHCGIAVEMMYSPGSSGAYSDDAARAFVSFFNYDDGLYLYQKNNFADSIWDNMIRAEIDSLRPVYYDGSGSGGHAFVCDGYQAGDYFHFNWGWSGSHNGYYTLANLNPGGMNFSNYCGAVLGMKPGIPKVCSGATDTLTAVSGYLSDGSYSSFYQNNSNCSWLITPPNASSLLLNISNMDLATGDSLYLYDGMSAQANLIASYGIGSMPTIMSSPSGNVFVQFISNSIDTAAGFFLSYQSEYCQGLTTYTATTGNITDGSGNNLYANNTNCSWKITDSLSRPIILEFDIFQTEAAYDFVNIYDGDNAQAQLLGSYSGNNMPPNATASSGKMFIQFTADGGVVDNGWSAHYYVCVSPEQPNVSDSLDICMGDSAMLNADTNFSSYIWMHNGLPMGSVSSSVIYVNQSGDYSYSAQLNLCSVSQSPSVNLEVNALPQPSLGTDSIICEYHNILLSPGNFQSYQWSNGGTTATLLVDSAYVHQFGSNIIVQVSDSNNCSYADTIEISLSQCLGIDEENSLSGIRIFPNPTDDRLWIINSRNHIIEASVIDAYGKEVLRLDLASEPIIELNVSELSSGIYFLILKQCTDQRTLKFLKK